MSTISIPMISGLMLGCVIGYLYRDHQLATNTFTRANLEVKKVYPAGNAELTLDESGKVMKAYPCPDSPSPVRFEAGMRFREFQYEMKPDCQRVTYFSLKTGEPSNAR